MEKWMKSLLAKIFIRIFNIMHGFLQLFGYELIPVTWEDIVVPVSPEEKKEVLRDDFNEPIRLIIEACNKPGNKMNGFQRYAVMDMIR